MRRFGYLVLVPAFLTATAAALAQQPTTEPPADNPPPAGSGSATAPPTPAPTAPPVASSAKTPVRPRPEASNPATSPPPPPPKPPTAEAGPQEPRLLAPVFGEDRYFGDGLGSDTEVALVRSGKLPPLKFAMHGYFRAPMVFSRIRRSKGEADRTGGDVNYRTPLLVDDDYYKSGFLYLPINERMWNETYLSVGNERMTATVGLMGTTFADSDQFKLENQMGVAQGWLTFRFNPFENLFVRLKGGAFWDRFGYLPKYDTYIFGRTHQVGGQARAEYQAGAFTFWALDGIGTHEPLNAQQGMTMVHYAHAGASYDRTLEVGVYHLKGTTRDTHPLGDVVDAKMTIYGIDGRIKTPFGRGYVAYSTLDANKVAFLAPAIEVMHSYGRFVMDNYLGTDAGSKKGNGFLKNLGFQYDLSVADIYRGLMHTKQSPLPWGGDVTISVFGLMSKVSSAQETDWTSPDTTRTTRRDGVTKWKWGTDFGWRATEWLGVFLRYDHVVPDTSDSAISFRAVSPRIVVFTHFLSQEQIFFQFSRYWYKDAVQRREGKEEERFPDEKVFKLQAQISY